MILELALYLMLVDQQDQLDRMQHGSLYVPGARSLPDPEPPRPQRWRCPTHDTAGALTWSERRAIKRKHRNAL